MLLSAPEPAQPCPTIPPDRTAYFTSIARHSTFSPIWTTCFRGTTTTSRSPTNITPLLVAAWLHHRFAQVLPFPDGNGRATRALVTWHLVRRDYLPIVVTRRDQNDYIDSLEATDDGHLGTLVTFTADLQRRAIQEAATAPN